jgi:large subunit ribosomal protein L25
MPEIVVSAEKRTETGKNVNRRLRVAGRIPGVVYGGKGEPMAVAVSPKEIGAVLRSASGENTLFDLDLGGSRRKVILKEYQVEPIKGRLLHADFYEVALDKLLEVKVHVEITGTPVGVKVQGGILDFVTREFQIEVLPGDIPESIEVDVSELLIHQGVRIRDVAQGAKWTPVSEPDTMLAHVVPLKAEEAPAADAAAGPAVPAEPEVIKKGKTEKEEEKKG